MADENLEGDHISTPNSEELLPSSKLVVKTELIKPTLPEHEVADSNRLAELRNQVNNLELKEGGQKVSDKLTSPPSETKPEGQPKYDAKYAEIAESRYDYGPLAGHGQAIIEAALVDLPEGAIVTEIGCSTGKFLDQLEDGFQKKKSKIIGFDINQAALPSAKKRHENVLAGDAQQLPFENESTDAIVSLHTYEHVPKLDRAFAEVQRVLKPGGKAYIIVPPNLGGLETIRVAKEELPDAEARGLGGWINALRYARQLHCSNLGGPFGGARQHAQRILNENNIDLKVSGGMRRDLTFANFLVFEKPTETATKT